MDKKKKIVKCNECWREFEIEDNEEWGYCPFCENDQVEATDCNLDEDWGGVVMEEKERYVIRYDLDYNRCLIDTEKNQGVGDYIRIVKLLNQQDKRIKELENMNSRLSQGIYWGNGEHFCDVVKRYKAENQQLKQQLAEKDKEIATLEVMLAENKNDLKELQEFKVGDDEYDLTDTDARFSLQCDLLNTEQDKISFAVEQLEKVKRLLNADYRLQETNYTYTMDYCECLNIINEYIDNQINELKGENK